MRSASVRRAAPSRQVLLVDDNCDGNLARRSVLEEIGYHVFSACCGRDALQILQHQAIDLIVTDYRMGPIDGLELIARVRATQSSIPIILLTGFAESLGLNCDNTGADSVIQKSAKELPILLRNANKLLQTPRKAPGSHQGRKPAKRASNAD